MLRRAEAELGIQLRNVWSSYDAFRTLQVGLPSEQVLEAFDYPEREELFEAVNRFKSGEIEDVSSERYRSVLGQVWERRFGNEAVGLGDSTLRLR